MGKSKWIIHNICSLILLCNYKKDLLCKRLLLQTQDNLCHGFKLFWILFVALIIVTPIRIYTNLAMSKNLETCCIFHSNDPNKDLCKPSHVKYNTLRNPNFTPTLNKISSITLNVTLKTELQDLSLSRDEGFLFHVSNQWFNLHFEASLGWESGWVDALIYS